MTVPNRSRRRADPQRALRKAIEALAIGEILAEGSNDWACALFVGRQHRMTIAARDADEQARLADFAAAAAEIEWCLADHLVADIAVTDWAGARLTIEVLTVEDD
jgi:hypothetical protein